MKKTRLIPFDYEKYKSGAKAVFRAYDRKIINILYFPENPTNKSLCVFFKQFDDQINTEWFTDKGGWLSDNSNDEHDVLLEEEYEEPKQKTVWINDYVSPLPKECLVTVHTTLEASQYFAKRYCLSFRGRLKVTYTDEDLIK